MVNGNPMLSLTDSAPPVTEEERAAARRLLTRMDALDLAPALGLDDDGDAS